MTSLPPAAPTGDLPGAARTAQEPSARSVSSRAHFPEAPLVRRRWWRRAAPYAFAAAWAIVGALTVLFLSTAVSGVLTWLVVVDLLLAPVMFTLLFFRKRWPTTVTFVIVVASSFLSSTSAGAVVVALISYAARPAPRERRTRRYLEFGLIAVLAMAGGVLYDWTLSATVADTQGGDGTGNMASGSSVTSDVATLVTSLVLSALIVGFCLAVGSYIGARRALLLELQDRAVRAESVVEASSERARTAERNRIAREMHDVLAHRISLVALHSGALSHRDDLPPEAVREAAEVISTNAHLALTELRQVLGVLRADNGDTGHREPPQPTLADVDALITDARSVGSRVRLSVIGIGSIRGDTSQALTAGSGVEDVLGTLSPTVSRTAYRVLQEALTNARKHAPDAVVDLELSGRLGRVLTLAVTNPMPFPGGGDEAGVARAAGESLGGLVGSGSGLTGLSERTDLAGGTLDHGIEPDGFGRTIFAVRAWLPWDESVGGWRGRGAG